MSQLNKPAVAQVRVRKGMEHVSLIWYSVDCGKAHDPTKN